MAPPPQSTDEGDEDVEEEVEEAKKHESDVKDIPDPLSPTSKKVRHFVVKRQYERKARNVKLKINKY